MTKLTKPVIRETDSLEDSWPVVVELHPQSLVVRLKGKREAYALDYDELLLVARRLARRRRGRL